MFSRRLEAINDVFSVNYSIFLALRPTLTPSRAENSDEP
jgi:hypothetical protein